KVSGLVGTANFSANLAPASPPRARPMARWARASRAVVRAYLAAKPSSGSAKTWRGHRDAEQKNRRTVIRSRTCRPKTGSSARERVYRLWTRQVSSPQAGQEALGVVVAMPRVSVVPSKSERTRRLPAGARRSWDRSKEGLERDLAR